MEPKWLVMMHWYRPSWAKVTRRRCRVVVYSITPPPVPAAAAASDAPGWRPRTWAEFSVSASRSSSWSFRHAKVMGEELLLAALQVRRTSLPRTTTVASGCAMI